MKNMKIYFAGSIRGGRHDKETYLKIIKHLKKHGQVLTEHIGNQKLTQVGEKHVSDEKIYERDTEWLEQADIVIAEVSVPSLGIGYELCHAEKMGKKVLCLYKKQPGKKLSAMIKGNKKLVVKEYTDVDEALKMIDDFFKDKIKNIKQK